MSLIIITGEWELPSIFTPDFVTFKKFQFCTKAKYLISQKKKKKKEEFRKF